MHAYITNIIIMFIVISMICMYVCMYVCMHVYIYIYIYRERDIHMYVLNTNICIYIYTHNTDTL